jgi:hypothetical protein
LMSENNRPFPGSAVLVFMLCLLVTLGLYGSVLQSWWCCDDPQILKHALRYSPWEYFAVPEAWRALIPYSLTPWLSLTYDLDNTLFGLKPGGYYSHNLLVIALCAWLICQIARQWVDKIYAFGAAVLFLVGSPVMVASQQLMVRHYLEGLLFYLIALWLVIWKLREGREQPIWLSVIAFAVAATAKEIYLPLGFIPFLLPIGGFRQRLKIAWPFLMVMLLYVPWRLYMLGELLGGYTPAAELGRSDLMAALGQFVNIPGLLLTLPWLSLSGVVLIVVLLFRRKVDFRGVLLAVVMPLLLLAPLIPLARQPGIGAGSDRYFIALWAAVALGFSIILGLAAAGRVAWVRLSVLAALVVLIASAWVHARQVHDTLLPSLQEQYVQGQALFMADSRDIFYLTSGLAPWYVSGLMDLRREFGRSGPPPVVVADELELSKMVLMNHRVFRYESTTRTMVESTSKVQLILTEWRKKVRPAALSVTMAFDTATKTMRWQLGPYQTGSYTLLPVGGRYQLPPKGALRMEKPPAGFYRFRYDAPEGWLIYSPPLQFVVDGCGTYRLSWQGAGLDLMAISAENKQ